MDVILTFPGAHPENKSCIFGPETQKWGLLSVSVRALFHQRPFGWDEFPWFCHRIVVPGLSPGSELQQGDRKRQSLVTTLPPERVTGEGRDPGTGPAQSQQIQHSPVASEHLVLHMIRFWRGVLLLLRAFFFPRRVR